MIWPEVFTNPDFAYVGKDAKPTAITDGLCGWGNCHAGAKLPESGGFGKGMVKIGKILSISATPDNLNRVADEFLAQPSNDTKHK